MQEVIVTKEQFEGLCKVFFPYTREALEEKYDTIGTVFVTESLPENEVVVTTKSGFVKFLYKL